MGDQRPAVHSDRHHAGCVMNNFEFTTRRRTSFLGFVIAALCSFASPIANTTSDATEVAPALDGRWSRQRAIRNAATGKVLWEFQTDASKENKGWVLTADRRFNAPLLFFDNWKEGPLVAQDRQLSVGSIFSSPLIASGTVYFGSTDGFLYAID